MSVRFGELGTAIDRAEIGYTQAVEFIEASGSAENVAAKLSVGIEFLPGQQGAMYLAEELTSMVRANGVMMIEAALDSLSHKGDEARQALARAVKREDSKPAATDSVAVDTALPSGVALDMSPTAVAAAAKVEPGSANMTATSPTRRRGV